jgi:hypothetical protein
MLPTRSRFVYPWIRLTGEVRLVAHDVEVVDEEDPSAQFWRPTAEYPAEGPDVAGLD